MFNKFQTLISNILEMMDAAPSPPESNSTSGGVYGPNATSIDTIKDAPTNYLMSIGGGVKPRRRKKKKSFFPVAKRKFPEEILKR
jgi:hypothetical protein